MSHIHLSIYNEGNNELMESYDLFRKLELDANLIRDI